MSNASTPLISVVTAFYNEEKFLEETILSVVNQSYLNWEMLLVDDGSPDGSPDIAKQYAEKYPGKVRYLHHENRANKGVCKSRNLGIANAKGDFVAYLDADDVWLPEKLSRQLEIFHNFPDTTVLLEASSYWYSWESPERHDVVIEVGAEQNKVYYPPQLIFTLYPLGNGAAPCPSGMMVRKQVHSRTLFVEEFIGPTAVYEDQAFLAQLYLRENVFVSSQVNNLYRQRQSSQVYSVHNDGRYKKVRLFYLNWFKDYLQKHEIHNKDINKLLTKNFFPFRYPVLDKVIRKIKRLKQKVLSPIAHL
jgi:glycosyltransferase involved in cell wall biosynthesis